MATRIPPWEDDSDYISAVDRPQCRACAHFAGDGRCAAFPEEIPFEIYSNQVDHRLPYPGDHGVRFAPLPDES